MGWAVQGKESCRIILGMLHPDQRAVLRHTTCYMSLQQEKFEDEQNMPPGTGFSSIVTALRTNFGADDVIRPIGKNLTEDYRQHHRETMRAFLERIKRCFSTDLNSDWDSWPRSQRKNLITRFLRGLTKEDYEHTSPPRIGTLWQQRAGTPWC